jgi:hypothetical protein
VQAMRSIDSHERLVGLGQMDWPNKKESIRSREWKDLHKIAYPKSYNSSGNKILSTKELFEIMRSR